MEHSRDLPSGAWTIPRYSAAGWPKVRPHWVRHCRRLVPVCWCGLRCPGGTTDFYARRFTHETAVHRADVALAAGAEDDLDRDVALDAIDEWMELGSAAGAAEIHAADTELPGPGRTLHFHATDTLLEAAAEWLVDLTGEAIACGCVHERAAVAVRGPLTDLLLIIYKRRPARDDGIEVFGDAALLDFWLQRVSFG